MKKRRIAAAAASSHHWRRLGGVISATDAAGSGPSDARTRSRSSAGRAARRRTESERGGRLTQIVQEVLAHRAALRQVPFELRVGAQRPEGVQGHQLLVPFVMRHQLAP